MNWVMSHSNEQRTQRTLYVMFYDPRRKGDAGARRVPAMGHLLNLVVAAWDGPYSHAEVGFDTGEASSIYNGETVFLEQRSFANPNYDILAFHVSPEAYAKVHKFCVEQAEKKVAFDRWGMLATALPVRFAAPPGGATFCSRFVTEALQRAGLLQGVDSARVSPSALYRLLATTQGRMLDTVPARAARLSQ